MLVEWPQRGWRGDPDCCSPGCMRTTEAVAGGLTLTTSGTEAGLHFAFASPDSPLPLFRFLTFVFLDGLGGV